MSIIINYYNHSILLMIPIFVFFYFSFVYLLPQEDGPLLVDVSIMILLDCVILFSRGLLIIFLTFHVLVSLTSKIIILIIKMKNNTCIKKITTILRIKIFIVMKYALVFSFSPLYLRERCSCCSHSMKFK